MSIKAALLTIAITACNASSSPSSAVKSATSTPPAAIASNPSPVAPAQSTPSPTSPSGFPSQSTVGTDSPQQEAIQVIRNYYRAISRRDYEQAYLAWDGDGAASQQSLEQFKQGFANTSSVAVEVGDPGELDGAAGSIYIKIPVTVTAVTTNGTPQRFRGSYVLRRVNDVPGSTLEQQQWHLYSADITQDN